MNIKLSKQEIEYLIALLGEQQTKTGAWVVMQNLKAQLDELTKEIPNV
jgi:hypothetical protein